MRAPGAELRGPPVDMIAGYFLTYSFTSKVFKDGSFYDVSVAHLFCKKFL